MHDRQASLRGKREYIHGEWGTRGGAAVGVRHLKVIEDVFGDWHGGVQGSSSAGVGAGPGASAGPSTNVNAGASVSMSGARGADDEESDDEDEDEDEGGVGDMSIADMSMDSI